MKANPTIKHILVAHDLSDYSDGALDYAMFLARAHRAQVTVLHAFEIPAAGVPELGAIASEWIDQIEAASRDALDKAVSRVRDQQTPIDQQVLMGSPWQEVDRFAEERGVDLIVVGSHGRHGISRALLGSVAEQIARTAPCPVLIVRPAQASG